MSTEKKIEKQHKQIVINVTHDVNAAITAELKRLQEENPGLKLTRPNIAQMLLIRGAGDIQ